MSVDNFHHRIGGGNSCCLLQQRLRNGAKRRTPEVDGQLQHKRIGEDGLG